MEAMNETEGEKLWGDIPIKKMPYSKRLFDICAGSIIFLFTLPLWVVIAVLIKLDSRGPVFFAHGDEGERTLRVGAGSRLFWFIKFRTMETGTDEKRWILKSHRQGPLIKIENDPRVTRVGKWLRKTSLDELPNILSVIRGDMSLVGPRPHVPREVKAYPESARSVLSCTPGITGLAQISGRSDLSFDEEIALDIEYGNTQSFWGDVLIMIKTVAVIVRPSHKE